VWTVTACGNTCKQSLMDWSANMMEHGADCIDRLGECSFIDGLNSGWSSSNGAIGDD